MDPDPRLVGEPAEPSDVEKELEPELGLCCGCAHQAALGAREGLREAPHWARTSAWAPRAPSRGLPREREESAAAAISRSRLRTFSKRRLQQGRKKER